MFAWRVQAPILVAEHFDTHHVKSQSLNPKCSYKIQIDRICIINHAIRLQPFACVLPSSTQWKAYRYLWDKRENFIITLWRQLLCQFQQKPNTVEQNKLHLHSLKLQQACEANLHFIFACPLYKQASKPEGSKPPYRGCANADGSCWSPSAPSSNSPASMSPLGLIVTMWKTIPCNPWNKTHAGVKLPEIRLVDWNWRGKSPQEQFKITLQLVRSKASESSSTQSIRPVTFFHHE